jgi:hypothetical protein
MREQREKKRGSAIKPQSLEQYYAGIYSIYLTIPNGIQKISIVHIIATSLHLMTVHLKG